MPTRRGSGGAAVVREWEEREKAATSRVNEILEEREKNYKRTLTCGAAWSERLLKLKSTEVATFSSHTTAFSHLHEIS
jgi:hypothetical protein